MFMPRPTRVCAFLMLTLDYCFFIFLFVLELLISSSSAFGGSQPKQSRQKVLFLYIARGIMELVLVLCTKPFLILLIFILHLFLWRIFSYL